jgi:hypothetical protein
MNEPWNIGTLEFGTFFAKGGGQLMGKCEVCGNEYDKAFQVTRGGQSHTFDSFECAIQKLAPTCAHCGCRIIGHGMEANDKFYCCAHCAAQSGVRGLDDRK